MSVIFIICLCLYIFMFLLRVFFAEKYTRATQKKEPLNINEKKYTVLQPILSGDPRLEADLRANLAQTTDVSFFWLIDKSDKIAQKIVKKILENPFYLKRVRIYLMDDVPQEVNPKVYKLKQVMNDIMTEYFIVLDDDSVVDWSRFKEMTNYENLKKDTIVTGIPYNDGQTGIWSKLVAAFVNSNAFLTYFPMANVEEHQTINGMFYISKTELFQRYQVFDNIQFELCDDLAVAAYLLERNVKIIQSCIPCNVRNSIFKPLRYLLLMKRWLLFTSIYMRKFPSLALLILIIIPSLLPLFLMFVGLFLSIAYFIGMVFVFIIKAFILKRYRNRFFAYREKSTVVVYEVLNDLLLPFLFLYTLLTPATIKWRNKKIKVSDGKIRNV